MQVVNWTNEEMRPSFAGRRYTIPPNSRLDVPEETAKCIVENWRHRGLIAIGYGQDEQQMILEGMKARYEWNLQRLRDERSYLAERRKENDIDAFPDLDVEAIIEENKKLAEVLKAVGPKKPALPPSQMLARINEALADPEGAKPPEPPEFTSSEFTDRKLWPNSKIAAEILLYRGMRRGGKGLTDAQREKLDFLELEAQTRSLKVD